MKHRMTKALGIVALTAVLSVTPAAAQGRILLGGGSSLALGKLADSLFAPAAPGGANNGPHVVAGYEYIGPSGLGFRVDGMWHRLSTDLDATGDKVRLRMLNVTGDVVWVLRTAGAATPYLLGGGGFYAITATGDNVSDAQSINKFGLNAGAGLDVRVRRLVIFAEGRVHHVFTSYGDTPKANALPFNSQLVTVSAGVKIPVGK